MEKGGLDEEERTRTVEKQKADEMRKFDWKIKIDERKDAVEKLKSRRKIWKMLHSLLNTCRSTGKKKRRKKRGDNDDDDDREVKKQLVSISQTISNIFSTLLDDQCVIFVFAG